MAKSPCPRGGNENSLLTEGNAVPRPNRTWPAYGRVFFGYLRAASPAQQGRDIAHFNAVAQCGCGHALKRFVASTDPSPVARSYPRVAGYAGAFLKFELDSSPMMVLPAAPKQS